MSSALTTITDLADELEDPGVVQSIQKHVADGCPLAPLVEAVTPDYTPDERPRLIAAMVERARTIIAHQNEHAANDAHPELIHSEDQLPKRGRPASPERKVRKMAAKLAGVSEETVRRHQKAEEPAEVIVPKPPKPQPVETRLQAVVPQLEEIRLVIHRAVDDMRAACAQFKWGSNDVRRRYMQDVERALAQVAGAKIGLTEVTDRMVSGKTKIFSAPTQELGEKPRQRSKPVPQEEMPLGLSEAPKVGLKAPKRVKVVDEEGRPLLPTAEETANAWADAARVGVGPSDDGDAF